MASTGYTILNCELMIKKTLATNHVFFANVTFSRMNSFTYISSIVIEDL